MSLALSLHRPFSASTFESPLDVTNQSAKWTLYRPSIKICHWLSRSRHTEKVSLFDLLAPFNHSPLSIVRLLQDKLRGNFSAVDFHLRWLEFLNFLAT